MAPQSGSVLFSPLSAPCLDATGNYPRADGFPKGRDQGRSVRFSEQQAKEAQGRISNILGKGTLGTRVGFVESKKELTATLFCGADVKLWQIPFTAGRRDWENG